VTNEELKKQYEEDCKNYERPWELWEFRNISYDGWLPCDKKITWSSNLEYRRKDPPFQPKYFSGLNWQDAKKLVGRPIEFSNDPGYEGWETGILESLDYNQGHRFKILHRWFYEYTRTCPDTFQDSHPTIRITVNGKNFDLPRPETEAPECGTRVYIFAPEIPRGYFEIDWYPDEMNTYRIAAGVAHFEENRAQAWADWWKELHKTAE
jgi:hypothetical protein